MKFLLLASLPLLAAYSAPAASLKCSIHPAKGASESTLRSMAKIKKSEAKSIALASYTGSSPTVSEGELESENNCLIYSFDIRLAGKTGVEEIIVDAGTGAIISRNHESPEQEALEAASDKAATGGH
jgi:uncharacterized membrane protein YkoI